MIILSYILTFIGGGVALAVLSWGVVKLDERKQNRELLKYYKQELDNE